MTGAPFFVLGHIVPIIPIAGISVGADRCVCPMVVVFRRGKVRLPNSVGADRCVCPMMSHIVNPLKG